jgi:dimethylaniline monooxygenase (N-oxide forming)
MRLVEWIRPLYNYVVLAFDITTQNAYLVSSKQLTCFSDFRLPFEHPDHLTLEVPIKPDCDNRTYSHYIQGYVNYLRAYAKNFNLTKRISLQTKVVNISRGPSGGHIVSYVRKQPECSMWETVPQTIHAAYIALCTGLHVIPSVPTIEGIEHALKPRESDEKLQRTAFHSVDYKSRSQLAGRRVMILGTGETGLDIAHEAAKAGAKEVVLCSRSGCVSVCIISSGAHVRRQVSLVSKGSGRPILKNPYLESHISTILRMTS